jgi:hypothetical protein
MVPNHQIHVPVTTNQYGSTPAGLDAAPCDSVLAKRPRDRAPGRASCAAPWLQLGVFKSSVAKISTDLRWFKVMAYEVFPHLPGEGC